MKKVILMSLFACFLAMGCETKTGTGALAGGAIGAGAGGLIGGGRGALIGGAVGALSGGLVGSALDEQDRKVMKKSSPRTVQKMDKGEPLTMQDIIKLSQGGVSDDTIIRYIQDRKTTYTLSHEQINKLQEAGVSQRVINYMISTGGK